MGQAQKQCWAEVQVLFSSHEYKKIILSNQSHRHREFGVLECPGYCTDTDVPEDKRPGSPALLGFLCRARGTAPLVELDPFLVLQIPLPHRDGQYRESSCDLLKNPMVVVYILKTLVIFATFSQDIHC